jgi:hypothetical protein
MSTKKLTNAFPKSISIDGLCIEPMEMEGSPTTYSIGYGDGKFGTLWLADGFKTLAVAEQFKDDVPKLYKLVTTDDADVVALFNGYNNHITKFNNEGYMRRDDFNTPEKYEALIKGIQLSIATLIRNKLNVYAKLYMFDND